MRLILPFDQINQILTKNPINLRMTSKYQLDSKSLTQTSFFRPGIYKQNDISTLMTNHSASYTEVDYKEREDSDIGFDDDLLIKLKEQRKKVHFLSILDRRAHLPLPEDWIAIAKIRGKKQKELSATCPTIRSQNNQTKVPVPHKIILTTFQLKEFSVTNQPKARVNPATDHQITPAGS